MASPFLTSALEGEWSASYPSYFTPKQKAPGTCQIEGWMVPRASPDMEEKQNILILRGIKPQQSCLKHIAVMTELS
jgi:hypothetical protein